MSLLSIKSMHSCSRALVLCRFLVVLAAACSVAGCAGEDNREDAGMDAYDGGDGSVAVVLGKDCESDGECPGGWCEPLSPYLNGERRYCTGLCEVNEDCSPGDGGYGKFCCVHRDRDQSSFCQEIEQDEDCGSQEGQCGDPCEGAWDSLCGVGLRCKSHQNDGSYCMRRCTVGDDCLDCERPEFPEDGFMCQGPSEDEGYCSVLY